MTISAEELGWLIAIGFVVLFAAELALEAYNAGDWGRRHRGQPRDRTQHP